MIRSLMLGLTSRFTIGLLSLLICVPMTITLFEVSRALWVKPDLKEEMEIVTGIGIIMIAGRCARSSACWMARARHGKRR